MSDYFDSIEAEILQAKETDPDAVFPWGWWKEKAEAAGMSPNAVYTRAVKSGLYVPPTKREQESDIPSGGNGSPRPAAFESVVQRDELLSGETETPTASEPLPSSPPPRRAAPEPKPRPSGEKSRPDAAPAASFRSSVGSGGLSDSIHGFASLFATALEQQVRDLTQAMEQTREENRRLRRALHQMEELSVKMSEVYRSSLYSVGD